MRPDFLPLLLLLLLLILGPAAAHATDAAARAAALGPICTFTDYPDLCISSIQSVAHSVHDVDPVSAAAFEMKALAERAHAAIGAGKGFAADPAMGDCLKDCLNNYQDGVENVDAARAALAARDKGTARTMLSAAFDSFSCADTFAEGAQLGKCRGPSPMKGYDDELTKLTSNSLAIIQHARF